MKILLPFDIPTIKDVPNSKAKGQYSVLNRPRIMDYPGVWSCSEHNSGQEKLQETFVIWSDEKWFMLKQSPNKQNEYFWYPFAPKIECEWCGQGGLKVMVWAGLVNGKVIIHWFDANVLVNGETYLEMLKFVVWPKVGRAVTSRQLWFQQDGASVHTTLQARAWLQQRFGKRVISRHTDHPWPAKSPDLSPLDYWFWSVAMRELTRVPPSSIEEMKATVEEFADSLDLEEVLKAVENIKKRAQVCSS